MPIDQGQYMHAMEEDVFTGKPMPKNAVQVVGSDVQLPVDIQSRYATTIQTHNAVSVAASGASTGTWIDCNGFDKVAINFLNDAAASNGATIAWSSDGVTVQGEDTDILPPSNAKTRSIETPVKLRYARVQLINRDAALAHVMSAWIYLKA